MKMIISQLKENSNNCFSINGFQTDFYSEGFIFE